MTAATLEGIWRIRKSLGSYPDERLHLEALPFILALTYAYVRLRPEDRARWNRVPFHRGVVQLLQGVGLGTAASLAWLGLAAAKGWISAPTWGWEDTSVSAVAQSLMMLSIEYLAVAWNEEMIFRGYLFETWRPKLGQDMTVAVLTVLFALYHSIGRQQLLGLSGMAAAGLALIQLRIQSDALWLPIGYHWAWNILQTAIFGSAGAAPSIRPLHVDGPYIWVGRPGSPEPGLLSTLIQLLVAVLVFLWMRRSSTVGKRAPA
jgi:membrane protease YdiL (CAAX protease family)